MLAFLNSSFGLLLASTAIAGIALFTWQRADWKAKQIYKREEVLLDRRIEIVERIIDEAATYLSRAANVLAAVQKQVGEEQLKGTLTAYNTQQFAWFSATEAHRALIALYFPGKMQAGLVEGVIRKTEELDRLLYQLQTGAAELADCWAKIEEARGNLRAWSASVWDALPDRPHRAR